MRRLLASLLLACLVCGITFLPGQAAAPPVAGGTAADAPAGGLFRFGVPKSLADLQALEQHVQHVLKKISPATVKLGGGSGVVVSKDGLILTVAHVNQKAGRDITVTFPDGRRVKGKTLGNFRTADAGMARITDKGEYPFVEIGKSGSAAKGQWCIALGYPVSFGGGMKPPVRLGRVLRTSPAAVTTDCPLMGGDSGGPLFDLEGRVIGMNSRVSGAITGNVHVAVEVYHTHWKRMLAGEDWGEGGPGRRNPKNRSKGRPKEAPKDKKTVETQRQPGAAVRPGGVRSANPNERNHEAVHAAFREAVAPAASSTVRILCDGEPAALGTVVDANLIVTKASVLKGKITCKLPDGSTAEPKKVGEDRDHDLAVLRVEGKGLKAVRWRTGGAPAQGSLVAAAGEKGEALGVGTVTVEPRRFGLSDRARPKMPAPRGFLGVSVEQGDRDGLRTVRLVAGGPAEKAGLKVGDVIKKLGAAEVKTSAQLGEALGKHKIGEKVVVVVKRGDKEETLTVTLGRSTQTANQSPYDRWGGGPFSERRFGFPTVLAHDIPVHPRDCGGPLVDTSGRVCGVVISRSLRVATYALLPADVERIVKKVTGPPDPTKGNKP